MTVELAIGITALAVVVGALLALVGAGVAQLRCVDAARAGARAASLGQDDAAVSDVVSRAAGPRASVSVRRADGWVDVTVRMPVAGGMVGPLVAEATAGVPDEP